jgi:hypothetical protein
MLLIISVLHCTLLSQNSGLLLFFSMRQSKAQRNLEDLVHGHLVFPTLLTEKGPNVANACSQYTFAGNLELARHGSGSHALITRCAVTTAGKLYRITKIHYPCLGWP